MNPAEKSKITIIETGSIYFFYRPKVERKIVTSEKDVQRFFVVLSPDNRDTYRLTTIGHKELPSQKKKGSRYWGYINSVSTNPKIIMDELGAEKYSTKTRGERHSEPARPAGEGAYQVIHHDTHTHLAYILELPHKAGSVQEEFNIEPQGDYIITVKNPQKSSPPGFGVSKRQEPHFPQDLENVFRDRRFTALETADFLDYEGTEFILVATSENIQEELGIQIKSHVENEFSADIFRDLKVDKTKRPTKPLFKGEWE